MTGQELAKLADEYWDLRTARLAADKVAAELKVSESRVEALLIQEMREQKMTAVGGQKVRLTLPLEPNYVPGVTDWGKLYAHILESGDFSLLERRVGRAAVKEHWSADIQVPGVERFPQYKLGYSTVKK